MSIKSFKTTKTGKSLIVAFLGLLFAGFASLAFSAVAGKSWYQGSVDEAFVEAKKQEKPILLYWGAKWCPPCNSLKQEVFSNPEFDTLMGSVVNVYLDGDEAMAQEWGDKLKASGYPTLLLLDSQGQELLRLRSSLRFADFKKAFLAALSTKSSLDSLMTKALSNSASEDEWRTLIYSNWGDGLVDDTDTSDDKEMSEDEKEKIAAQKEEQKKSRIFNLYAKVKENLAGEKFSDSLKKDFETFRYSLISQAANLDWKEEKSRKPYSKPVQEMLDEVTTLLGSPAMVAAHPNFILGSSKNTLSLQDSFGFAMAGKLKQLWLSAADSLAKDNDLPLSDRLWIYYPHIEIMQWESESESKKMAGKNQANSDSQKDSEKPKVVFSDAFKKKVAAHVDQVVGEIKTEFQRKSIVPNAAYLLGLVDLQQNAISLLKSQIDKTDSPYYMYSGLSGIYKKMGDDAKALDWSAKAAAAADGKATKIQWTTIDLTARMKMHKDPKVWIDELIDYYKLVFSYQDGYLGRNYSSSKRVANAIKAGDFKGAQASRLMKVVGIYSSRCASLTVKDNKANCMEHFASIMDSAGSKKSKVLLQH